MSLKKFKDQLNREIEIKYPPKRIISLVPSQTELLFDLGLNDEVVGITKFCIHPKEKFKSTNKIGGTKKLDLKKIRSLNPDLIISNKEENQQEDIENLMQEFPVWISDIYNLEDAIEMISAVGAMVGKETTALAMVKAIANSFEGLKPKAEDELLDAAYFIWKNPDMAAGKNTYIDEMLYYCGLKNCINTDRYPSFSKDELGQYRPKFVLLSSEPYPFKEKHINYFNNIWPGAKVKLVDGEMFSWYGSRLLKSAKYFEQLKSNLF